MLIGVISDTHGRLDPTVEKVFAGVDRIVHAGDVGDEAVLARLRAIAPLTAVRGNGDDAPWAWLCPALRARSSSACSPAARGQTDVALRCCCQSKRIKQYGEVIAHRAVRSCARG